MSASLAAAAALLAPSVAQAAGLGLPLDASAEGWRIDRLFASTHILVAAVAVIAFGGLVLALLLFRAGSVPRYTHGTTWRAAALPLAAAAFVLVVIDGNLMCTASRDLKVLGDAQGRAEHEGAVRIQVTARQWSWEARYEGGDGEFGTDRDVVVLDHLRVPIGRPVVVQLASVDVVHALNLPNFRVKMQAIPGRINMVWFQAEQLGRFEIACAQHCGPFHYKMRGVLEVLHEEDFEAWLQTASVDAERSRREHARADAEQPAERSRWPVWREPPLTGAWSWAAGLRGEGAPDKLEADHHDHDHDHAHDHDHDHDHRDAHEHEGGP